MKSGSSVRAGFLGTLGLLFFVWQVYETESFSSPAGGTGVEPFTRASSTPFGDELMKLRDPFRRGTPESAIVDRRPQLERLPVDAFQLVGVSMGPNRVKAILQDAEGRTFLVSEKMRLGNNNGIITKISPESIFVREKLVNVLGEEENVDLEIRLPGDGLDAAMQDAGPSEGTAKIGSRPSGQGMPLHVGSQGMPIQGMPPQGVAPQLPPAVAAQMPVQVQPPLPAVPPAPTQSGGYQAGTLNSTGLGSASGGGLQAPAQSDRPSQVPGLPAPTSQGGAK